MFKQLLNGRAWLLGLLMIFLLTGCSITVNQAPGQSGSVDAGGVFRSNNHGDTWQSASLVAGVSSRPGSIGLLDSNLLIMDPSDQQALYFASQNNGLAYTYDGGNSWQMANSLDKINVQSVAVDYFNKCFIFVASANRLMRSSDCGRTWSLAYNDNEPQVAITSLLTDHHNGGFLYLGTSRGDVLRSADYGGSWHTVYRFSDPIRKITMSPRDSRVLFVATEKKGIFRTQDSGANWDNLSESLNEFKIGNQFSDLVVSLEDQPVTYLATDYGLFRSVDYGEQWTQIELLTPSEKTIINTLAINPLNSQEIYYVTDTTFYRSLDGGQNWSTKKLPTSRAGWSIVVNPQKPEIIYLSVKKIKREE